MGVTEVKTKADFDKILEDNKAKLIVVDFTATWCGPCQTISPKFEEYSGEFDDVVFLKVDVDVNNETAEACNVECMPTFKFYKIGKEVDVMQGANAEGLKNMITKNK